MWMLLFLMLAVVGAVVAVLIAVQSARPGPGSPLVAHPAMSVASKMKAQQVDTLVHELQEQLRESREQLREWREQLHEAQEQAKMERKL